MRWLNIKEACQFLKVSSRTLQTYRDNGMINFSQINDNIYFRLEDIDAFLNKHQRNAFNAKK